MRSLAVTFEAENPAEPARFWAGLLGREVVEDTGGVLLPGEDTQLGLRFVPGRAGRVGAHRMHLHLTSENLDGQRHTVATAISLGGRHADVGQRPEEPHVVLADPAGYEFCVIEPGNDYLAGCGPLGELTCAGSRQAGLFWSKALGWPLVWDRGEQTAIQSPRGGTKVAWDTWESPPAPSNHQRFELLPDGDQRAAADELVSLGATRLGTRDDGTVVLADPDGTEFRVRHDG
ncbi:VOC family protein [Amycolatopsis sp. SID8362]|uniref:VOC family protein n=1 Tax=Amycolatopsis sp. SID8362 TaxID=2690346 RepID=UPI001371B316|nr:VOC family protein [Amycolatopsis sp. SID8362]NBH03365.1 VOC family protein [Amycolatopsis sp. SID8362]NED40066.1 VOC family protein [Amycolatopsis sp. SID8362]